MGRVLLDPTLGADGLFAGKAKGGNLLRGVGWARRDSDAGLVGKSDFGGDELVGGGASGPLVVTLTALAEELAALEAEGGAVVLIADIAANGAQVLVLGAVILHSAEAEGEVIRGECVYSPIGDLKRVLTPWAPKREVGYHKPQTQTEVENNTRSDGFH